jgi:D-3-phosphoglycerate dehydrogenase
MGKRLGVIGFGRIGQGVAARARAFEMEVAAYDPHLDASVARRLDVPLMALAELLEWADVVTLHVPFTEETKNLIGEGELARMKPGALLVNCARGGVVDEGALLAALEAGKLGGAAVDVFAEEPPTDWRLATHARVVATPHIGAQTVEAQERISLETTRMVLAALEGSLSVSAVNLPFRPAGARSEPFLRLGEQLGRLAGSLLGGSINRLRVDLWGVDDSLAVPVTIAAVKGALSSFLGEAVNFVNAEKIASSRGIEVVRAARQESGDYPHLVGVTVGGDAGEVDLAGALFGERDARVVRFRGFRLEFRPEGCLMVLSNRDVPGVVGRLGTLLGEAGVNIAEIHLARVEGGGEAMAVLRLDQQPPADVLARIAALPEIRAVQVADLR